MVKEKDVTIGEKDAKIQELQATIEELKQQLQEKKETTEASFERENDDCGNMDFVDDDDDDDRCDDGDECCGCDNDDDDYDDDEEQVEEGDDNAGEDEEGDVDGDVDDDEDGDNDLITKEEEETEEEEEQQQQDEVQVEELNIKEMEDKCNSLIQHSRVVMLLYLHNSEGELAADIFRLLRDVEMNDRDKDRGIFLLLHRHHEFLDELVFEPYLREIQNLCRKNWGLANDKVKLKKKYRLKKRQLKQVQAELKSSRRC
jgi:hypothetical protein